MFKLEKKKVIIILSIMICLIIVIGATIVIKNNKESEEEQKIKTSELYEKIIQSKEITYTETLDENNKITIMIKNDNAYKEVTLNGRTKRYIVKEGNTYYLDDIDKKYYKYQSNDEILTEIREKFESLNGQINSTGKERINGNDYEYEEIARYQDFLFNNNLSVNNLENAKTRLYYKGEDLMYIKTIVGENEEILKININYNDINNNYFDIPSDYTE